MICRAIEPESADVWHRQPGFAAQPSSAKPARPEDCGVALLTGYSAIPCCRDDTPQSQQRKTAISPRYVLWHMCQQIIKHLANQYMMRLCDIVNMRAVDYLRWAESPAGWA